MELLAMSMTELTRLQAMSGLESRGITQAQAALQLGLSVRQVKRLWRRYRQDGAIGLISRHRGKPSNRRTDPALIARAVELVQTLYPDFGPTFAAEKLAELHAIELNHETLRRGVSITRANARNCEPSSDALWMISASS
jgi:transposase